MIEIKCFSCSMDFKIEIIGILGRAISGANLDLNMGDPQDSMDLIYCPLCGTRGRKKRIE